MILSRQQVRVAEIAAFDAGVGFRGAYSGRGMYGRQCIAIVVSSPDEVASFLDELRLARDEDTGDLEALLGTPSSDTMGRNIIVYWPSAEVSS